jgi:hypothetical protein
VSYRVAYYADPAVSIRVNLIRAWERGEIDAPVMSASSGPKDYIRNHIWAIFDRFPRVARVLMVRGEHSQIGKDQHPSPPFLLAVDAVGEVWDMAGKPVVIQEDEPL